MLRITFDERSLVDSVVARSKTIVDSDGFLNQKLSELQGVKQELKRTLSETLKSLSSARAMGSASAIDLLSDKRAALEQCIRYVTDCERGLLRSAQHDIGFDSQPPGFATPQWGHASAESNSKETQQ